MEASLVDGEMAEDPAGWPCMAGRWRSGSRELELGGAGHGSWREKGEKEEEDG
jgi:hypothetical protein